jgi:cytochrome c oxidase subunit 3
MESFLPLLEAWLEKQSFSAGGGQLLSLGLAMIIYSMFVWWRDVVRESTFMGHHTSLVQLGLRYGMILFIASEVMFFLAFFWAFFHSSLAPSVEIGAIWPPKGISVLDPWEVPFLNTIILLSSGAAVTWAHHAILNIIGTHISINEKNANEKNAEVGANRSALHDNIASQEAITALAITVALALIFTGFQAYEYLEAPFTISDGIYASTFYLSTGFHGFHVIIGTIFLFICLLRLKQNHFTKTHHFGFEAAAWYWHMVDVIWLFLFVCVYYWGGV